MAHARKKKTVMKKVMYDYDGFSRAYNKKKELVAYIGTLTWLAKEGKPKEAKGMKHYRIWLPDWVEPVEAHATNVEALKTALGFHSKYAREWGDYAGVIQAIDNKNAMIEEVSTTTKEVDY